MNLAEQLDEVTSTQPYADRPAAHYVAAGRRARTRRRMTLTAVGATAAVVIGVGALATAQQPGGSAHDGVAPATHGSTPATPHPTDPVPTDQVQTDMAATGAHAGYDTGTGELVLDDGWRITQRIDSPWQTGAFGEAKPPTRSVALALTDGADVQWILLDYEDTQEAGAIYDDDPGARGFTSLAAYVDAQMARRQTRSTDELVAFDGPDRLTPRNGVTILDQGPVALADGSSAVLARLRVLDVEWYVVARRTPSGATFVPVDYPGAGDPPGLAGFLTHVDDLLGKGGLG